MSAKAKTKLTPQQRKATLTRVLGKIKPYSLFVVCSLVVAAVSVGAQLYIPILCGSAIDMMLGKGAVDFGGVMRIIIEVLVVAGVAALAQWLLSVCNNRITFLVSRNLRNEALRKIQTLPLSYLDSHPSGDIVSRMVADVDTFADGLLMGFTQLFSGVLTILGTLLFMLSENVPITLVVVCITPLSLVVASFLAKRSYGYFQSQSAVRGEQTALVNEMIEGQKVVQAFGHEAESLTAFDEVNGRLQDVSLKAIFFSSLTNPATRFVNNIVYAGVGLVGAVYAVRGGITIGQLSVFLSYANQYTKPFNEISGVVTELQNALACAARVFELLDADDQVPEVENASVLQPDGHVQLEDVSFRYLPDRPLIEGLSLDVKPGQRIAIVGPTGCGKTTLINLLMRFYDVNGGSIKVSGTDIRDVTRASLRGSYGMVLQDTWLRAGTVRENIAYGKPDASLEEIVAAAKAAHADSFIRRLPEGYDTVIAEDGGNISQGQKQLLCIARVMLCLPPMLILDEATSSIDTRTEVRIQKAFARGILCRHGGKLPDQPQPVIPLDADQRVRVAVFRLKHDARRQLRHQPALPRDTEFIRKIRADMRNRMNCVLHGNVCPLFVVYYIGKEQILQLPHLPTIVEIWYNMWYIARKEVCVWHQSSVQRSCARSMPSARSASLR